jgi:palmitoyltransferase
VAGLDAQDPPLRAFHRDRYDLRRETIELRRALRSRDARLTLALGIAVPVLMAWHLHMVSHGETSIESHDNAYLEGKARAEGLVGVVWCRRNDPGTRRALESRANGVGVMQIYLNPYDLGRRRNLELFFNIGPTG